MIPEKWEPVFRKGSCPKSLSRRRRNSRVVLHRAQWLAAENENAGGDDDGRTDQEWRVRHVAEDEIAEHHRPQNERVLKGNDHARGRKPERAVDEQMREHR